MCLLGRSSRNACVITAEHLKAGILGVNPGTACCLLDGWSLANSLASLSDTFLYEEGTPAI